MTSDAVTVLNCRQQAGKLMEEGQLMRAFVQIMLALQYVHSKVRLPACS